MVFIHTGAGRAAVKAFFAGTIAAGLLMAGCAGAMDNGASGSDKHAGVASGPASLPIGEHKFSTDVLLYAGDGAWDAEVRNVKSLLDESSISYKAVSSDELNAMSAGDITGYGLIVWVGGEAGTQSKSLTAQTKANLREAVQKNGVSWLGFCAGSFIAAEPDASLGVSYGVDIVQVPGLKYYYLEDQDTAAGKDDIDLTLESFPDGSSHNILWYGGPVTPGGPNTVAAKYPNGDPAVSELWSGNGLVILSGVHPATSMSTLQALGVNPSDGDDRKFALDLIQAGIRQQPVPTFKN